MFISVFNTGSHYVDQVRLELPEISCLCLWSSGIKGNAQPHLLRVNFLYFEVIIESLHLCVGACLSVDVGARVSMWRLKTVATLHAVPRS